MINFEQGVGASPYFIAVDSGGVPVTGVVVGDLTIYVSKNGATATAVIPTSVIEIDSTNAPGGYSVALPAATFNTVGTVFLHITIAGAEAYRIQGEVILITNSVLDSRTFSTDTNVDGLVTTIGSMETILNDVDGKVDDLGIDLITVETLVFDIRALAAQAGFRITGTSYDLDNHLTDATIEGYNQGDTPGVDVPRVTLTLEATYNGTGQMTEYKVSE